MKNKNKPINIQEDLLEIKGQSLLIGTTVVIVVIFMSGLLFAEQRQYIETKRALSAQPSLTPVPTQSFVGEELDNNPTTVLHEVKKGESLAKIGNKVCKDKSAWKHIAQDNKISAPYTVKSGQLIQVHCK